MTRGQPARDALDAIDEAVARISDAEVDRHLAKILRQGGFRGSSVPFTEAPLRLKGSPGGHGPARLTRLGGWAAPLAAAAAVVLVVICAAAGSWLFRSLNGRPGDSGAPARGTPAVSFTGAPAGPYAGVPAYYVEIANPSLAVVRATATGVILARVATRTPFVGVTGGADDRTFVLDAQRSIMGPAVRWPGHPAFYLLRLSSSGAEESFTQLNIAAPPDGTAVAGMALSPDSSKLAVALDTGTPGAPGLLEIRLYTLATGTFRTWSAHGLGDSQAPEGFTGSGVDASESISWAADSRTLAFDEMNQNFTRGVRLLDTAASGSDLIADSRLAVTERAQGGREALTSKDHVSQCVTNSIISADGSAIVCGYTTDIAGLDKTTGHLVGLDTTTGFIRYSASTGKQTAVLGVHEFKGQAGGDISLYWVNSTGNILIGGVLTPGGIRVGVINGEKFTPLPGITHLGAAAW